MSGLWGDDESGETHRALTGGTHEAFVNNVREDMYFCWFGTLCITLCCPCCVFSWALCLTCTSCGEYKHDRYVFLQMIVSLLDKFQTLCLFPLTVVVIFTSNSGAEIFVNLVAVHVFGNLDDVFASDVTTKKSEILNRMSKLYFRWNDPEEIEQHDIESDGKTKPDDVESNGKTKPDDVECDMDTKPNDVEFNEFITSGITSGRNNVLTLGSYHIDEEIQKV